MKEIKPVEIKENLIDLIKNQWMLVTAGNVEACNTMTASWGFAGYIWNRPVAVTVVRPQRYTYQFMEKEDTFSLCFFDEEYRDVLKLCGSQSGRDIDKIKASGLSVNYTEAAPYFDEAKLVLICRKIAVSDIDPSQFIDADIDKNYPNKDYHRSYTGEILKVLEKA